MPIGADDFKAAMALRASGVSIVTARAGEEVHGMTMTDFAGVSLAPPLALICADKTANTLQVIRRGGNFAINLLAAGQGALSNKFASKKEEWTRFEGLACARAVTGAPLIPGAIASLDCRVVAEHDAGDHVLVVGEIEAFVRGDGDPLLYFRGGYRGLASAP
jgi:flavin reductase (DIM6/NTAB) family NADH-FMN oxidoreductase RutF